MGDFKALKNMSEGFSVLYVEDNESLRINAAKLLQKIFKDVYEAEDGKEGLRTANKYRPQIIISDIKMPNMDGLTLGKKIKKLLPDTKFILMSAFDDKEKLMKAIEIGAFRFLKKPVNVNDLGKTLYEAISQIKHEESSRFFYQNLENIFNYQSSMVVMLKDDAPSIANQNFLDFFNQSSIDDFQEAYPDLGTLFMPHDGFLYNDEQHWYSVVNDNKDKIYHVKMNDIDHKVHHFLLKSHSLPQQNDHLILSFDDVTELNLLKLFDEKESNKDKVTQDIKALFKLLKVLQRNSAKIQFHNYYKGLSIINDGIIVNTEDEILTVKTTFLQQRAIRLDGQVIITNEALPHAILCESVDSVNFEKQTINLTKLKFILHSAVERSTIRVVPDEKATISLFIGENKFHGDIYIEDISIDAIKLKLNAMPAGLNEDDKVILDIVLELDKRPLIINTEATLYHKKEVAHSFYVVFKFGENTKKKELIKYISKRQMEIIREFKRMQNG